MKITKLTSNCNALMNLFLNIVQKELQRLLFQSNQEKFIYLKTNDNANIIISNLYHDQTCCPVKLIKTLKKTKSISFKEYSSNNFWNILSNCQAEE